MNERRPEHFVPGCSLLVTVGVGLRIDGRSAAEAAGSWRTDVTAVVSTPLARVNREKLMRVMTTRVKWTAWDANADGEQPSDVRRRHFTTDILRSRRIVGKEY